MARNARLRARQTAALARMEQALAEAPAPDHPLAGWFEPAPPPPLIRGRAAPRPEGRAARHRLAVAANRSTLPLPIQRSGDQPETGGGIGHSRACSGTTGIRV
ncbi:conserved hypothetical protein [Ricinus communis]|uniref:Uncharacterized protein n=1 Tax=Ricinus communis TaxID=3988 RepID=B9TDH8_RICCO|nr:conserved hypothetical protein [Ricinus communis]